MAQREKVVLAMLTIIIFQIASKHCLPSLKIPNRSIKTRKYFPKYSIFKEQPQQMISPVVPVCKAFQFPEIEYPKAPRKYLNPLCTKYKAIETLNNSNATCNCQKSSRIIETIKRDKKKHNNTTNMVLEPIKAASLPFCFNGRFPEVEYPLNVVETWSPKYWTQLPKTEIKKCTTSVYNQDIENVIKTTNADIEKALDALLRSQQTSPLQADTCPLNSQAMTQFLTSDEGNVTLIANRTTSHIDPQALDIRDSEENAPNNDKSANKSNGQDTAMIGDLPNKNIIPSSGGSDNKNEDDLPDKTTISLAKLVPSGESILSNEAKNSSDVASIGTDQSSIEALLCPVIRTDNIESVILAKNSLRTNTSKGNATDSPIKPNAVSELDDSVAGSGIPKKSDPSADSVISDSYIPKSCSVSSLPDDHSPLQYYTDKAAEKNTKSQNPEKDDLLQDVPETDILSLISATPDNSKSIISEVDSSPSLTIPNGPSQEKGDLSLESVVKETSNAPLSKAISPTISTVPDVNESSTDLKTLANTDSSFESTLQTNNPNKSTVHRIKDTQGGSSESADYTIPEISSTPSKSTIPDKSDSFHEYSILNKDDAPVDTNLTKTDDFPTISQPEDIKPTSNNTSVPNSVVENVGKSSSLSDSSASVETNIMEIQEYDYTTVSPFYNDLEENSLNYDPDKETWILDPNDKEYLIVW